MQEVYIFSLKSLVYGIYRDYQKSRTYALRGNNRIGGSPPIKGTLAAGSPPLIFRDLPLFLFKSFKSFENANPANLMMME